MAFGFEPYARSVARAKQNAKSAGLADRAMFSTFDGEHVPGGPYDLITINYSLHHAGKPVELMTWARAALKPGGAFLVTEYRKSDEFQDDTDTDRRVFYATGLLECLPAAVAEGGPGGTRLARIVHRRPAIIRQRGRANGAAGGEPPRFDEAEMHQAPEWAYFTQPANWGMTREQQREAIRAYYAAIAFLDVQVGKVLDALERLGVAERTVVVFWGDNGYQLGEHGQWMKQTVFERAARVPLLVGGTGIRARGRACPRTVELLDLYPTLAAGCGLQSTPSGLQGRSLLPLLDDARAAWNKPAVSQVRRFQGQIVDGYSLRTERYRYSEWGAD